ncbi:hypothetical protein ACJ72_01775 [Emergomyces africanus]|uniref:Pyoverdine/dityrosine biosynthesis protein n=1 Tax=Emergomyces africanus TaxID=1955775 RepID=A0A1B7P4E1_9EURO|nr:hypothetical protein ACJ72_01775 [Emergomyces africanus]
MPETDLVSMVRETCTPDPLDQGTLKVGRENGLHIHDPPFNQHLGKDGYNTITVSVRRGADIVIEKVGPIDDHLEIDEDGELPAPQFNGPKTSTEVSKVIISILEKYRIVPKQHSHEPWEAKNKISSLVQECIEHGEVIPMVLPAFPFKSPNKKFKVLGHLPDKGEEVALAHLNRLCELIENEYEKGARIDIVSDGLMYNDLLGISDNEVWAYGQALRKLAADTGCRNINFVRLVHLLGEVEMGEPLTAEQYLKDAAWFRTQLYERNIPENFDVSMFISNDPDTTLTYRGYIKFLEKDLDGDSLISDQCVSKRQVKKRHEATARNMISRGRAFAIAIAKSYNPTKGRNDYDAMAFRSRPRSGWIHSYGARRNSAGVTHELIFEHGRPSYFREKSPLYDWGGVDVEFQNTYPSGILISPRNRSCRYQVSRIDMRKVRALVELCSPVILKGWLDPPSQSCCLEADTANGICRHGNSHSAEHGEGTVAGMNDFPRMRNPDRYASS